MKYLLIFLLPLFSVAVELRDIVAEPYVYLSTLNSPYTVSDSLILSENMMLQIDSGALINITSTGALVVKSPLIAPKVEIFRIDSGGTLNLGGQTVIVYPEWFGALKDNPKFDNRNSIINAIKVSDKKILAFSSGTYYSTGFYVSVEDSDIAMVGNSTVIKSLDRKYPYLVGLNGFQTLLMDDIALDGDDNIERLLYLYGSKDSGVIEICHSSFCNAKNDNALAAGIQASYCKSSKMVIADSKINGISGVLSRGINVDEANTIEFLSVENCSVSNVLGIGSLKDDSDFQDFRDTVIEDDGIYFGYENGRFRIIDSYFENCKKRYVKSQCKNTIVDGNFFTNSDDIGWGFAGVDIQRSGGIVSNNTFYFETSSFNRFGRIVNVSTVTHSLMSTTIMKNNYIVNEYNEMTTSPFLQIALGGTSKTQCSNVIVLMNRIVANCDHFISLYPRRVPQNIVQIKNLFVANNIVNKLNQAFILMRGGLSRSNGKYSNVTLSVNSNEVHGDHVVLFDLYSEYENYHLQEFHNNIRILKE